MTREEISRQSHAVWEKVFQLPQYQSSQSVGLFLSMPTGEIHTYSACERVLSDGKTLYLPGVGLDFEKCDMELVRVSSSSLSSLSLPGQLERRSVVDDGHVNVGCSSNSNIISTASVSFYESWPRNKWGIPEPLSSKGDDDIAKSGDIDLMIVPGLGFDRFGGRLGQGKGYYDRFLSKMMLTSNNTNDIQIHKPFLVAVGLEPCLVSDEEGIPMSPHDFRMDMVILPNVVLDCDCQSS
jgi:5-formyltetrahydrofolate cyclo-ligase